MLWEKTWRLASSRRRCQCSLGLMHGTQKKYWIHIYIYIYVFITILICVSETLFRLFFVRRGHGVLLWQVKKYRLLLVEMLLELEFHNVFFGVFSCNFLILRPGTKP